MLPEKADLSERPHFLGPIGGLEKQVSLYENKCLCIYAETAMHCP